MILAPQIIYYYPVNIPSNSFCSPQILPAIFLTYMDYFSSRLIILFISFICPSSPLTTFPALFIVLSSLFYYSFIKSSNNNNNYKNISDLESNSNIEKRSNQGNTSIDNSQGLYYKKTPRRLERNNKLFNIIRLFRKYK
jgi:hypothetical protein